MSHSAQRKQNECLNCGAVVAGRFCHVCGQENIEPKESFWHLVTHFVYDITHFDGKFFSTVKYLLLKPGFLSREYIAGRRMRYLNPIKMYVFISAFFFLFFFSVVNTSFNNKKDETEKPDVATVKSSIEKSINDLQKDLKDKKNTESVNNIIKNQIKLLLQDVETLSKDTSNLSALNYYNPDVPVSFGHYKTAAEYDSVQNTLPPRVRDKWLERFTAKKIIELQTKYGNNEKEFFETVFEKFKHSFPQLLFVSLPLLALLLKLLYVRRKNFYYTDHVIYSVHLYCAMFILMFIIISISKIQEFRYLSWVGYFTAPLIVYVVWYQYKSLKNFYRQTRLKTIVKYFLLLILASVVMSLLFIVFLITSVLNL